VDRQQSVETGEVIFHDGVGAFTELGEAEGEIDEHAGCDGEVSLAAAFEVGEAEYASVGGLGLQFVQNVFNHHSGGSLDQPSKLPGPKDLFLFD